MMGNIMEDLDSYKRLSWKRIDKDIA